MKRVGVIGGGQLAWMMAGAAKKLGVFLVVQTPNVNDPAVRIAHETVFGNVDDAKATAVLAGKCDVITFENEFVNLEALSNLASQGVCFRPRLEALAPLLDKYYQRCYLRDLGLLVPKFSLVETNSPFLGIEFPVVLKTRRHGYDGQGTFIIKDLQTLISKLGADGNFFLEEFIPFERELAVIAARCVSGKVVTYPVVETQQEQQVCRRVIAPAQITPKVAMEIENIAHILLTSLEVVGVFGIELFLTGDEKVLVNEVAPRTHNSGHFSLDACETSQFEMQLLAICGLPLKNPVLKTPGAVMVNLLGFENSNSDYISKRQQLEKLPQAQVYWYGKRESRIGRKLGHITVLLNQNDTDQAMACAREIEYIWYHS